MRWIVFICLLFSNAAACAILTTDEFPIPPIPASPLLDGLTRNDFEAVDTSILKLDPDSGQATKK